MAKKTGAKSLNLTGQRFRLPVLPVECRELIRLRTLDIHDQGISELPSWLAELPELQQINISGNPLSTMPGSHLPPLIIDNLQWEYLGKKFAGKTVTGLRVLTAGRTPLLTLLENEQFHNLSYLSLRSSKLLSISFLNDLVTLKNLTSLYLGYNNTSEWPAFLGELKSKRQLNPTLQVSQ